MQHVFEDCSRVEKESAKRAELRRARQASPHNEDSDSEEEDNEVSQYLGIVVYRN